MRDWINDQVPYILTFVLGMAFMAALLVGYIPQYLNRFWMVEFATITKLNEQNVSRANEAITERDATIADLQAELAALQSEEDTE